MRKILQLLLRILNIIWMIILVIIAAIFGAITLIIPFKPIFWLGYLWIAISEYFQVNNRTIHLGKYTLTSEKINKLSKICFIVTSIITIVIYRHDINQINPGLLKK